MADIALDLYSAQVEDELEKARDADLMLADEVGQFYDDPLGFVMFAYEWGEGDLSGFTGPRKWQEKYLHELGLDIKQRNFDPANPVPVAPIRKARASGHGIGKSALCAWIVDFLMSTRPFANGVVTANTNEQLRTKTWAEVAKWHRRSITGHWFSLTTSSGNMALRHKVHRETWKTVAQTCREENSEAFAGLHAANSSPFFLFDESSRISDKIQEVAEGGLTDGHPFMLAWGNPTRGTGWFHRIFHALKHRWDCDQIDSRKVEGTNKTLFNEWADDFGVDSDFYKVRVTGQFPSQSDWQFISRKRAEAAAKRLVVVERWEPIIIGVDVARRGTAMNVIQIRRGRDARTFPVERIQRSEDTMQLVGKITETIATFKPDAVFVDGGGVGGPVVDRLHQLGYHQVHEVNFGSGAGDRRYAQKRSEMWGDMKDWLLKGAICDDEDLLQDLTGLEYGFNKNNAIQLEDKEHMVDRGLASPDWGDALALTFAWPVGPRNAEDLGKSAHDAVAENDYHPHDNL